MIGDSLVILTLILTLTYGHVRLNYPIARDLTLDFLDNIRTPAPCGMPKGPVKTTLITGHFPMSFNCTVTPEIPTKIYFTPQHFQKTIPEIFLNGERERVIY